jgi:hypothetical protein
MNYHDSDENFQRQLPPIVYEDTFIKETLAKARTIAMVGASTNWNRPSYFAMKYLQVKPPFSIRTNRLHWVLNVHGLLFFFSIAYSNHSVVDLVSLSWYLFSKKSYQ